MIALIILCLSLVTKGSSSTTGAVVTTSNLSTLEFLTETTTIFQGSTDHKNDSLSGPANSSSTVISSTTVFSSPTPETTSQTTKPTVVTTSITTLTTTMSTGAVTSSSNITTSGVPVTTTNFQTTTESSKDKTCIGFDGWSFFGGIILGLALCLIFFLLVKYVLARKNKDVPYRPF